MPKPSVRIQGEISHLAQFRNSYIALINASNLERGDWYDSPRLSPKVSPAEWGRLKSEVAHSAGAASAAYDSNGGGTYTLKNAAFIMQNVNPIANWVMSLESPDELKPELVIAAVDTALGVASTRLADAQRNERGLVGLIAAFLRWPSTLRAAVGPSTYQRGAASAIGVVGQIVVGALAAALGAALVAGVVELWRVVT